MCRIEIILLTIENDLSLVKTNDYSQFKKNYLTDIFDISATAAAEAAALLGRLIMFKQ